MSEQKSIVIEAYRRIRDASKSGKGVRLSADECWTIWNLDDAVSSAVQAADEIEAEKETP